MYVFFFSKTPSKLSVFKMLLARDLCFHSGISGQNEYMLESGEIFSTLILYITPGPFLVCHQHCITSEPVHARFLHDPCLISLAPWEPSLVTFFTKLTRIMHSMSPICQTMSFSKTLWPTVWFYPHTTAFTITTLKDTIIRSWKVALSPLESRFGWADPQPQPVQQIKRSSHVNSGNDWLINVLCVQREIQIDCRPCKPN